MTFRKVSAEIDTVIGRTVTVTVDRPLGSYHPKHKDIYYPINYGYVKGIMAAICFTKEEIWEQIRFQEQYFDSEIIM